MIVRNSPRFLLALALAVSAPALAQLSGVKTVCASGCDYTTLTGSAGAFSAINAAVVVGNIELQIAGDLTVGEDGSSALNAWTELPPSGFTVKIYPTGSARFIGGTFNGALIRTNGASRVTIDGSIGAIGTDRSLTITNTSVTTPTVVAFGSIGSTAILDDTLKNCIIFNGATTGSAVLISDAAAPGSPGHFSNITIQNNDIRRALIGVYANGGTNPQNGANLIYSQNVLNAVGVNAIRQVGLYLQGVNGATVSQNIIANLSNAEAENDAGIWLATGTGNATVSGNTIANLGMTAAATGAAPTGIRESSGRAASGNVIGGNTVTNLATTGPTAVRGIDSGSNGVSILGNKVQGIINNNVDTFGAFGIDVTAGNNTTIQNNFVSDINHDMSGGFAFDPNFGVVGIRLGAGTGHKVQFNSVNLFGPHTGTAGTSLLSAAFSISTTAQTGIDVRNNIFANNIGGGSTGIAHVSVYLPAAGTSAMNLTWNNNAYYFGTDAARQGVGQAGTAAGANFFTTLGAVAAYTSTLAPTATNDNASIASSLSVPYLDNSNLHVGPSTAVANTGTSIAGVNIDIDGDTRMSPPEIGADELDASANAIFKDGFE